MGGTAPALQSAAISEAMIVPIAVSKLSFQSSTEPQSFPSTLNRPPVTSPNWAAGNPPSATLNSSTVEAATLTTTLLCDSPNQYASFRTAVSAAVTSNPNPRGNADSASVTNNPPSLTSCAERIN